MITLAWIDAESREPWQQMALDRAMADWARDTGDAILRLYRWRDDTLSLGANESAARTWDRNLLERDGIPCVRRPSGGRGVWHARADLTYAWAGPSGGPAGVRQRYRDLHDRIATVIAARGLATVLAAEPSRAPGLGAGACFDTAVGGEVLVAGRKRVGSAQKVIGDTLLQHGALALADGDGGRRYRLDRVAAAHSSRGDPVLDPDDLAVAIHDAWLADGARRADPVVVATILAGCRLHEPQFRDPAWTWRR